MFEEIYESMMGFRTIEGGLPWVPNAFADGEHCMRAYEEMRDAYERICERLDVGEEDDDLNIIVDCFESMQKELCERMFSCGLRYALDKHFLDSYYKKIGKEPKGWTVIEDKALLSKL